jgi:ubiquinone/menaquinone biosynthesis C-methylase UbiE
MELDELVRSRDASVYADFFLPYVNADTHILDLGCGDGALSIGLAAVARQVTAVDVSSEAYAASAAYAVDQGSNLVFVEGDAAHLEYTDESFDACFCHSILEAVPDPAAVLAEVWRVVRPGGHVGVASTEYGGLILAGPGVELLRESNAIREQLRLRWGSNPFLGRKLRGLVTDAGFEDVEATTKAFSYGTPPLIREFAEGRAAECWDEEYVREAVAAGLATADQMFEMAKTWSAWGESSASYAAVTGCRAVGRRPAGRVVR